MKRCGDCKHYETMVQGQHVGICCLSPPDPIDGRPVVIEVERPCGKWEAAQWRPECGGMIVTDDTMCQCKKGELL